MASTTRASAPSTAGINSSSTRLAELAASFNARSICTFRFPVSSVGIHRLRADRSIRPNHDLLDLHLRLAQLRLAMLLEQCAAFIRADRLVELVVAALQLLHQ